MLYIIYKLKFCRLKIIIMLKNFMKPRKNASAIPLQKKNVEKRRAQKPVESDSDYSDSSDSEYEEILISSMKGGKTNKKVEDLGQSIDRSKSEHRDVRLKSTISKSTISDLPPPLKLERSETKPVEVNHANHANHFTEPKPVEKSEPIDTERTKSSATPSVFAPKPKSKSKSKRVVIKKYYNYKPKSERKKVEKVEKPVEWSKPEPKLEPKPVEKPKPQQIKPRSSYIGIGKRSNPSVNMSNRLSNRILNW